MLRAIRHAARTGFTIDKKTLKAIEENRELLLQIPPARLVDEVKKDLTSGAIYNTFSLLEKVNILHMILT